MFRLELDRSACNLSIVAQVAWEKEKDDYLLRPQWGVLG
jgi:hypothetical protein